MVQGNGIKLEVEKLSINFAGVQALANIDILVKEGELLTIIGPNGAGKTCLLSILLVEQNARIALNVSENAYIMENGAVVLDGTSAKVKENEDVREFYLGFTGGAAQKKSYRQVKHYKRRKRWLG